MTAQVVFAVVALLIMGFIIGLLRSRRLLEKYAALWIVVGLVSVVLALFPAVLGWFADVLGVQVPSNLLFALALLLLLGVALHLSLEISRLEDETRVLAEHVAILDLVVKETGLVDDESEKTHGSVPATEPDDEAPPVSPPDRGV